MPVTKQFTWVHGTDSFGLSAVGLIFELEERCNNSGIAEIQERLRSAKWRYNDVRETIRLGLIGGGMSSDKAMEVVKRHIDDDQKLAEHALLAYNILDLVFFGVPDEPLGKAIAAGAKETTASSSPVDASAAPLSTGSDIPLGSTQEKPISTASGNSQH